MLNHYHIYSLTSVGIFHLIQRQRKNESLQQTVGCEVLNSDITANSWGLLLAESAAPKLVCLKASLQPAL